MVLEFTTADFESEVLRSDVPVLVDFWAEWCPPCRMLAPVIDDLAGEAAGRFKIGKINADEHPALAARFRINALPTVLIFSRGEVAASLVGVHPKATLLDALDRAS